MTTPERPPRASVTRLDIERGEYENRIAALGVENAALRLENAKLRKRTERVAMRVAREVDVASGNRLSFTEYSNIVRRAMEEETT